MKETKQEILKYCVENPDTTVEEIIQKFKVDMNEAFRCVQGGEDFELLLGSIKKI